MFLLPKTSWEIKNTKQKGNGVFAKKDIAPGIVIGDYRGKVLNTSKELLPDDKENFYLMYYHDTASIFPDLKKPGIHLLNHSCAPNCWMYVYKGHTLFFSLRKIFKGEELTIAYLLSPQEPYCTNCTHTCICGSFLCTHSLHLSKERYRAWSIFHEKQMKETKKQRIQYNKDLPLLKDYPQNIPDDPIYTLFGSSNVAPFVSQNTILPSVPDLRKMIRESGKTIVFPKLKKTVLGIMDNNNVYYLY